MICYSYVWEQRKFAECFDYLQNNTLSRADLSDEDGEILNVHYGDILVKFGEVIDIATESLPTIADDNILAKYINSVLQDGDVVIADAAEDETVGKCSEIKGCKGRKVLAGLHTIPVRPKVKYANGFLGYFMNSAVYHNQLLPLMQGTKVSSISKTAIQDTSLNIPSDIEEQKSIADYFMGLDNLITLHQCKPINRWHCEKNVWEQRKVSDLLQERNEQAPMDEEYPLMAFIANQGVAPKGDRYDRSALVNDEAGKKYKRTEYGDFIYSSNNLETGSIGLNKYGNACISPVYSIFKPTGKADLDFLGRRFLRKDFINEMVKWRQGVVYGQWKIHESDFLKIEIAVPSIDEQKAIGQYFDNLDNLITLHQRKCEELQKIKKYMLQNMFA